MLTREFVKRFHAAPQVTLHSPGRVNLIGEHTDYNGGAVLPMALHTGMDIFFRCRPDMKINIASDMFEGIITTSLETPARSGWADYAIGGLVHAYKHGLITKGADLYIHSALPHGSGLSSSAALVVGILKAARLSSKTDMSDKQIALLAREVENEFLGVPCGIMDQMAISIAAPGTAILLDTKSLEFTPVALPGDHHMAVVHSGITRRLTDGRYHQRKQECESAARSLGVDALCLLEGSTLEKASQLPAPLWRRVRHCVNEHHRTLQAYEALTSQDLTQFGALMHKSHQSMRDDFCISLPEIDALVEDAINLGALGARLTGAGFGGCIVACIPTSHLPEWKERLLDRHPQAYYVC